MLTLDQDVIRGGHPCDGVWDEFDVWKGSVEAFDVGGVEVLEQDGLGDLIMVLEKGNGGDEVGVSAVDG